MNEDSQNLKEWRNREVGCLWRRGKFLTGVLKLENVNLNDIDPLNPSLDVIAFVNKKKDLNDKKPDVVIYLSKKQENPMDDLLGDKTNEGVDQNEDSENSNSRTLDSHSDSEDLPFDD